MQILVLKISMEKEVSSEKLREVSLDMNDHEDLGMMEGHLLSSKLSDLSVHRNQKMPS